MGSVRARYLQARDPPSQIAQVRRHLAKLVGRTLELPERARLVGCRARDVLRAFTVPARDLGDARHSLTEPADFRLLHARCVRDALPPGQAGRGGFDDRIERGTRRLRKRLDIAHHRLSAIDLRGDLAHLVLEPGDDVPRVFRRLRTLLGELSNLVGNDGKTLPLLTRTCRLDRRVECEQVGLVRELLDHGDEVGDAPRALRETAYLCGALAHEPLRVDETLDGHADGIAML